MTCPRPDKQRHPSRERADAHIGSLWRDGKGSPDMSAYRCGDHWHVGHDPKKFAARIRRALNHSRPGRGRSNRRRVR